MVPALLVVLSFVAGLRLERSKALAVAAAVAGIGIALVVVLTVVDDSDFLDGASGYLQLAAGLVAALAAALAGGAVRDRRLART